MWGEQEIPLVQEMKHLGVLISADGSLDAHLQQITQQGNARVGAMSKLLRDPYLTVSVFSCSLLCGLASSMLLRSLHRTQPSSELRVSAAECSSHDFRTSYIDFFRGG